MMVLVAIGIGLGIIMLGAIGGSVVVVWVGIAVTLAGPIGYLACRDARGPCRHTSPEQPSPEQPSPEQSSPGDITIRVEIPDDD